MRFVWQSVCRLTGCFLAFWLASLSLADNGALDPPSVLVVCPQSLQAATAEWQAYRTSQGYRLQVLEPNPSPAVTLRQAAAAIRESQTSGNPIRTIVLIGDVDTTPTQHMAAEINARWGSESHLATDHAYANTQGDQQPELAIGRITCRTPETLSRYLSRVVAYERYRSGHSDNERLTLVAAPGNFSPLIDTLIETTARRVIAEQTPPTCQLHVTYASPGSCYCPSSDRLCEQIQAGLGQRSLAWVYLGHGLPDRLSPVATSRGQRSLLTAQDVKKMPVAESPCVATMLACYTGAFDARGDCLAETMLNLPHGPLAVIAGTRVTMPYGNSVLGLSLMKGLFRKESLALGEIVRLAKCETLAEQPTTGGLRTTIELVAKTLTPNNADRQQELIEHVQMYHLLGDPLLRLKRPQPLPITATVASGGQINIAGVSPFAGDCRVELVPPHNKRQGHRTATETDRDQTYLAANRPAVSSKSETILAGPFRTQLAVSQHPPGDYWVRVYLAGEQGAASGWAAITLAPEQTPTAVGERETDRPKRR